VRLPLGDRPQLEHHLALVRDTRAIAATRLARAERSDPAYVAWRRTCAELIAE
jgi:hypothetical protein